MTARAPRVAVFDIQPILPMHGGARARLAGLFGGLHLKTHYVGTFGWKGPRGRRSQITDTLLEELVPVSDAHHAAVAAWEEAIGLGAFDLVFDMEAHHSPDLIGAARAAADEADIVVFSQPWSFPVLENSIEAKTVIYDAHNAEGLLRGEFLLHQPTAGRLRLFEHVLDIERRLVRRADLVIACSHDDARSLATLHHVEMEKFRVATNGAFLPETVWDAPSPDSRPSAIFMGSDWPPNNEAARFINDTLAPQLPEMDFLILGSTGKLITRPAENVTVKGVVSQREKDYLLSTSTLALNPVVHGSGTNVKLSEYLAHGLPTVTSPFGARGLPVHRDPFIVISARDAFARSIRQIVMIDAWRRRLSENARVFAAENLDWRMISRDFGRLMSRVRSNFARPYFSVIIPTLGRPDALRRLLDSLADQTFRDFEVIVIDQGDAARDESYANIDIYKSEIRGAARARNLGAFLARGRMLAFTDDDCIARPDWLEAAREALESSQADCLEGGIVATGPIGSDYRVVTNVHTLGLGFMTANLIVRAETFRQTAGFDTSFDSPSFREDTDLGWRLGDVGHLASSAKAIVQHPTEPLGSQDTKIARNRFFIRDAQLYAKHPDKFLSLIQIEGHIASKPDYADLFFEGARHHGVEIGGALLKLFENQRMEERVGPAMMQALKMLRERNAADNKSDAD